MSEVTMVIRNKKYLDGRMNNCYILGPSSIFIFFPDCHTLIFLKMKCNPTNKKNLWPNRAKMLVSKETIMYRVAQETTFWVLVGHVLIAIKMLSNSCANFTRSK